MPQDFNNADIYLVGGAVRDKLLNLKVREHDYVVVGITAKQMLQWGFKQVGADFPVFLHPVSHEEYALARTERKSGKGHKGFVFSTQDITLEQDLYRRDLTINAIAEDKKGQLIDPYNGQDDINRKILRHVSDAFIEDPLRVLRVARFAARFAHLGFIIADNTMALMQDIAVGGELADLAPERITTEMFKALSTDSPHIFFQVLKKCRALEIIFPEVDALFGIPQRSDYHPEVDTGVHVMMSLADAAKRNTSLMTRYAVLCHDLGKANTPKEVLPRHHGHEQRGIKLADTMSRRLKVSKKYREIAIKTAEYHSYIHHIAKLTAKNILKLFKAFGVAKDLSQFGCFIESCISDYRGRLGFEDRNYPQAKIALKLAYNFQKFDNKTVINKNMNGEQISNAINKAQIDFINNMLIKLRTQ